MNYGTERNRFLRHLPLLLAVSLLLAGCIQQPTVKKPVTPPPAAVIQPEPEPLAVRWNNTVNHEDASRWLLNRIEDKQVRTLVKKSLKRNDNAAAAVKRLNNARWRTAKAQEVMKTAFSLNGSGASLNTSWEKRFWKSFASDLKNGNSETSLTDQDLARLRDSLVAQTTKTILYAKGLEALAKAADEQLVMLQQIQTRMQTGFTLGRQEEQAVRRAEEELLTASRQREQLTQARAHAIAALEFLIGSNPLPGASTSSARVKAPARGLSSTLVDNRPDVQHAIDELAVSLNQNGNDELVVLPDFPVTGKGGRPTKALDKQLSGKKRKSLQAGDGLLAPGYVVSSDRQQAALAQLGKQLVIALAESRDQLRRGRQHQGHVRQAEQKADAARDEVKAVRGRFNAGRTDLTSILKQQIPALGATGMLGYSQQMLYTQRIDAYMALGGLTN